MSLNATLWAWQQDLTPPQKLILLSMADRAGEDFTCWPSYKRLEANTGLNRKTIVKHIKSMKDMGLIEEVGRKGRTGQVKVWKLKGVNSTKNGTVEQDERVPLFPSKSPKNGTAKESQNWDTESTIRNLPLESPNSVDLGLWEEWVDYRNEIKKKITKSAGRKQIEFLAKYSPEKQRVIINQSIMNGWQGLFPPKEQASGKKSAIQQVIEANQL